MNATTSQTQTAAGRKAPAPCAICGEPFTFEHYLGACSPKPGSPLAPRTDPRSSNIVPFPPPALLDAPAGTPTTVFFEQQALLAVKAIREKINNFAHAVEVWRRYFPGEEFPGKALAAMRAEHERVANLICRANDAVNLEPARPGDAGIEE